MKELLAEVITQCDASGGAVTTKGAALYAEAQRLLVSGASDEAIAEFLWPLASKVNLNNCTEECRAMTEKVFAALPKQGSLL